MTDEQITAIVKLTADLYVELEEEQAAHAETRTALSEVRVRVEAQDRRIGDLQGVIAGLVPSCGTPPT